MAGTNDKEGEKESETDTDGLERYKGDDDPCLYGKEHLMEGDDEDKPVKKRKEYGLYDTEEEREDLEGPQRDSEDYEEYGQDIEDISMRTAQALDDLIEEEEEEGDEESETNTEEEDDDTDDENDKKYYFDEDGNKMSEDQANAMPSNRGDTGENGYIKYNNINEIAEEVYKVDDKIN